MRPDPIAALAEAWGREIDDIHPTDLVENILPIMQAADAKRTRKAAKRVEDAHRTARGKWLSGNRAEEGITLAPDGEDVPSGFWDAVASGFTWDDYEAPLPQWKWRALERRALPGMERPWWAQPSAQARGPVAEWSRGLVRRHAAATRSVWAKISNAGTAVGTRDEG